jgi:hypothetical protein
MDVELPYDITDIDPSVTPGVIPPLSHIELTLQPHQVPAIDPCVKLLTLPYSYGRPVFVEFSQKTNTSNNIQDIDLTEMPGFTMVENKTSVDHIMEFGHHVKLFGGDTHNICLDVWCDETAPAHTK